MPPTSDPASQKKIRKAFDQAAVTYQQAAHLQQAVCDRLLQKLVPDPKRSGWILDAGCGTGHASAPLAERYPEMTCLSADFSPAMLTVAQRRNHAVIPVCCDIQQQPFADASLDGLFSSLALQWCDPSSFAAESWRILKNDGWLAIATLGPKTFTQIAEAFARVDTNQHILSFTEAETLQTHFSRAGFRKITIERETRTLYYPDLKTMLKAIKSIGAQELGQPRRAGLLGRTGWNTVQGCYEQWRTEQGLPTTYDVIYLQAEK